MKFYRPLQPIKLISFDLDDTLYDNSEVIRLAEQKFLESVIEASQISLSQQQWQQHKQHTFEQDPIYCEDVVAWRSKTLIDLLQQQGKTAAQSQQICQIAMAEFVKWRHKINIPEQSIDVLNQLKTRFPLVAITNGNVDPLSIGLNQFSLVLRGGEQGRAKPHADLFQQTAEYFQLNPQQILHVGDHLVTDVQGAIQANCQAAWLNLSQQNIRHTEQAKLLPTLEIKDLTELLIL